MPELPLSPNGRRYGWIRRPRRFRTLGVASIPRLSTVPPPPTDLHLEQYLGAVKDQGDLGACTAFAGSEDREAIAAQYEKKRVTLSPLFLYYLERQLDGTLKEGDCGSTGETSCEVLNQFGICAEQEDSYNPNDYQAPPTTQQLKDALTYKAGAYHSILALDDIKTCINSGYRTRIGMAVYESFENTGSDGLVPIPNTNSEQILGGHETLVWGYDDTIRIPGASMLGALRVRNSWGASWGLGGDYWLSYQLADPESVLQPDYKVQHLGGPWLANPITNASRIAPRNAFEVQE